MQSTSAEVEVMAQTQSTSTHELPMASIAAVLADVSLVELICSHMPDVKSICRAAECCQLFKTASASNLVWHAHTVNKFPQVRKLQGVSSYKMLYLRLVGSKATRSEPPDISTYQFMITLMYGNRTVYAGSLHGGEADMQAFFDEETINEDDAAMRLDGDDYVRPTWTLEDEEPQVDWLPEPHEESGEETMCERMALRFNAFNDIAYDDAEEGLQLEMRIDAFRASDQCTTTLVKAMHVDVEFGALDGGLRFIDRVQDALPNLRAPHRRMPTTISARSPEADCVRLQAILDVVDDDGGIEWQFCLSLRSELLTLDEDGEIDDGFYLDLSKQQLEEHLASLHWS